MWKRRRTGAAFCLPGGLALGTLGDPLLDLVDEVEFIRRHNHLGVPLFHGSETALRVEFIAMLDVMRMTILFNSFDSLGHSVSEHLALRVQWTKEKGALFLLQGKTWHVERAVPVNEHPDYVPLPHLSVILDDLCDSDTSECSNGVQCWIATTQLAIRPGVDLSLLLRVDHRQVSFHDIRDNHCAAFICEELPPGEGAVLRACLGNCDEGEEQHGSKKRCLFPPIVSHVPLLLISRESLTGYRDRSAGLRTSVTNPPHHRNFDRYTGERWDRRHYRPAPLRPTACLRGRRFPLDGRGARWQDGAVLEPASTGLGQSLA